MGKLNKQSPGVGNYLKYRKSRATETSEPQSQAANKQSVPLCVRHNLPIDKCPTCRPLGVDD